MISMQERDQLRRNGYTDDQIDEVLNEIQLEEQGGLYSADPESIASTFQHSPTDNLIKWQLELNDILERAEHILREDVVVIERGKMTWKANPNPEKKIFNEYGVQEIMRILSMYINRNTILSDYQPNEICDKVFDFGKEVNDLVYMKYEDFGLDTLPKRKNYPMLIRELIDIVHSAYKRALYGGERDSLRTARQISQQESIMPPNVNINTGEQRPERGILNPMRWVGGRYK